MVLYNHGFDEVEAMAYPDTPPHDVIDHVASELGMKGRRVLRETIFPQETLELTESFAVWTLGLDAVTKPNIDLSQLARQTGQWQHQIKIDGKAEAFARSMPLGPNATDWPVRALFKSHIAERIDEAIDWVDHNVQGDPLVRLLIVLAYHLHAFWLVEAGNSHILVVDMPSSYTTLQYRNLYTAKEFLETLAQEQHIIGIR
jgi:hypothetical protein